MVGRQRHHHGPGIVDDAVDQVHDQTFRDASGALSNPGTRTVLHGRRRQTDDLLTPISIGPAASPQITANMDPADASASREAAR
jgi:hypothetical protein